LRQIFEDALKSNYQKISNFKLKLGHKNLIINLCRELQNTTVEEFNSKSKTEENSKSDEDESDEENQINIKYEEENIDQDQNHIDNVLQHFQMKEPEEIPQQIHEAAEATADDSEEMVQYIYESDGEGETIQFTDQEFLETYDQDNEVVEMVYEEVPHDETENDENLYMSEEIIKSENQFDSASLFEIPNSKNITNNRYKFKRPKHMYTEEFLATQKIQGRVGTPGKRRPKIKKNYPNTEEGLLER
jgi:hypothetical protein